MAVPIATDRMWVRHDLAGHGPSADGNTVSVFAQCPETLQSATEIPGLWVISMAGDEQDGVSVATLLPNDVLHVNRIRFVAELPEPKSPWAKGFRRGPHQLGLASLVHPGVGRESWIDLTTWPYSHATARLSQRVAVSSRKPTTDISAYTLGGTGSRPVIGSAM